jgi:c-di-GMP-binding flagellar brake protein YcgR
LAIPETNFAIKNVPLEVNDLVQVAVVEGSSTRAYSSRVEDSAGQTVSIAWPTDSGTRIPFHASEELFLTYQRKDAIYGVKVVVEQTIHSPIPVLVVRPISETQRIQRREFVRVATMIAVELVGKVDPAAGQEATVIKANTIDLSGGGFSVHHQSPLPEGTVFETKLSLPGGPPLKLLAKIVRNERRVDVHQNRIVRIGLMFLSIPESARSRIVRYVFEAQTSGIH